MDPLTRRSAVISSVAHCLVVAAAWLSTIGKSEPSREPEPPKHQPEVSLTDARPEMALGEIFIAAEDAAAGARSSSPPLPALPTGQHPSTMSPSGIPVISPLPTDRPGMATSRGKNGAVLAGLRLPASPSADSTVSSEIQSLHANTDVDRAERIRRTCADHLDSRLRAAYRRWWRRYDERITQRQLVVQMKVDRRGLVAEASLFNSSGVEELDLLIVNWLKSPGLGLPPIEPGVTHRFRVELK